MSSLWEDAYLKEGGYSAEKMERRERDEKGMAICCAQVGVVFGPFRNWKNRVVIGLIPATPSGYEYTFLVFN